MKKVILLGWALLAFQTVGFSQECLENAKEVEPPLNPATRMEYERKLKEALNDHQRLNNAESFIWQARRTAYLGSYKESIHLYSIGISKSEAVRIFNPELYRHRGHRYITIRCFDDAIHDLEKAAKLVKGKSDEVEPDGLPNAKNIPTGTLQSNIWYHLGLAYYLKGDFKAALGAYKKGQKVSKSNDMRVAMSYWQYMTLRRLGKTKEAAKLLEQFAGETEVIENTDYLKLIKMNRGEIKPEALLSEIQGDANTLGSASLGYGIGNYLLYNGDKEKASDIFRRIVGGNQWASFGYIAAEQELARQKHDR